jgi:hypothetical protein
MFFAGFAFTSTRILLFFINIFFTHSSKALPSQAVCSSQALPSLERDFCYFSSTFFLHRALGSENQFYLSFDMPQTNMANCVWNRLLTRVANPRQQTHLEYT